MSDLSRLIRMELERHEEVVGPYFNLRCKCGHVETTVSRRGDFECHVADNLAAALGAAGLALAYEVLDEAATAAKDPNPEEMDRYFIDQADVGPWLQARAAAERAQATSL